MNFQVWISGYSFQSEDELSSLIQKQTGKAPQNVLIVRKDEEAKYAFVNFDSDDDAASCILRLDGYQVRPGITLRAKWNKDLASSLDPKKITDAQGFSIYIAGFPSTLSDEGLLEFFKSHGYNSVISAKIQRNTDGTSRCFGFVKFEIYTEMVDAKKRLNGNCELGSSIKISEAVKNRYQKLNDPFVATSNTLHIYNLDPEKVNLQILETAFSNYGNVTKVMFDPTHKDWAYVVYTSHQEAETGMNALQNSMLGGTTACKIVFGRLPQEKLSDEPISISVPLMKPQKGHQNLYPQYLNVNGVKRIRDFIDRTAELRRPMPLPGSNSFVANKRLAKDRYELERVFDWSSYTDEVPPSTHFWFF